MKLRQHKAERKDHLFEIIITSGTSSPYLLIRYEVGQDPEVEVLRQFSDEELANIALEEARAKEKKSKERRIHLRKWIWMHRQRFWNIMQRA